ncbi:YrhB domain-containing protein [Streptomyces formicae]|uniref:Serine protease n=1 Tax=Streptomyces formicae TaxID=1616117 RepID=A0ABY3WGC9_9ACTN|nr:YrhB domain-containing protein [Streptomyces formicae]UNM11629.1 serine protease [Streptomyces formicae]
MLSQKEAFEAARAFLTQALADRPYTIVLQPELSQEHPIAWLVRFDSREHLDTGDVTKAPFTRVVVVPKDGSAVHFPPSRLPVADYLDLLMRGEWPPKKA